MSLKSEKKSLRREYRVIRGKIPEHVRKRKDRNITKNLFSNIPIHKNKVIALYSSIGSEVDTGLMVEMYQENGNEVCLPRINQEDKIIDFKQYKIGSRLVKNKEYGILEPQSNCINLQPDYIIMPLITFDSAKNRLGYGGGFYDKTIENLRVTKPESLTIGIAYSEQQAPLVPIEIHDIRLDAIVTDEKIFV